MEEQKRRKKNDAKMMFFYIVIILEKFRRGNKTSVAGILFAMKIGRLMLPLVDLMVPVMQFLLMKASFVIIAISLWLINDLLLWRRAQ